MQRHLIFSSLSFFPKNSYLNLLYIAIISPYNIAVPDMPVKKGHL